MKVEDFAQPERVVYFNPRAESRGALAVADLPTSSDLLCAEYRGALARWHVTKSEVDRRAVRESYKRFGGTFCDAAFVEAEATRKFGVA